jgi:peptidylprolyl isomerase
MIKKILLILCVLFIAGCASEVNTMTTATLDTTMGIIKIELASDMPITTGNFEKLAKEEFYDGTRFHRVIDGFMIQGGDPLSKQVAKKNMWGTGGPGYQIKDEFTSSNVNSRGTISMANAGPNTGGSQFFINMVDNNFLDDKHPVFGKVVEGMDIVDAIGKVSKDNQDKPLEDVIINKVTIQ